MYWSPEGKPITAKEFVERMFADMPKFFENEDQLREIWSDPTTREKLLNDLVEAGYGNEMLDMMRDLIDAKDSDVYDVLRYVAYATDAVSRQERVNGAIEEIHQSYPDNKQQQFIDFILSQYVQAGVGELSRSKMQSLITLKYSTIDDAIKELGDIATIKNTFVGFQRCLYGR
tara:strand:- start:6235 stop:6753 length:519 start_codon:yes stop_codon:yes gene_type:complete